MWFNQSTFLSDLEPEFLVNASPRLLQTPDGQGYPDDYLFPDDMEELQLIEWREIEGI